MNRFEATFQRLRREGRKGLIGYLTAGDPDAARSEEHLRTALESGVDVLEIGVPFSDPTADGPVIQEASLRALRAGMTVAGAMALVKRLRKDFAQPIVLFGYVNPFARYGFDRLAADAAGAGADGFLVVDLPQEEAGPMRAAIEPRGLCWIPLVAPTTPPERARMLLAGAKGFVYYIMVTGVTGARAGLAGDVDANVKAIRSLTDLPVAVGFGVSDGRQAMEVGRCADAVVVGSALVKAAAAGDLAARVRDLRKGLDGRSGS